MSFQLRPSGFWVYKLILFDTGKRRRCPDLNLLWQYAFTNVEIYLFLSFAKYVCDYIEINAVHFWHFKRIPSWFDYDFD